MLKTNKVFKIFIMLFIFLILIVCGIAIMQYQNIKALYVTKKYTKEEISKQINEKKQLSYENLKNKYNIDIKDISAEDEEKLLSNSITVEEIVQKYNLLPTKTKEIYPKKYENTSTSSTNNIEKNNNNLNTISEKTSDIMGQKIGSLYTLKASYLSKLGELEATAKSEYENIPKDERNKEKKREFAYKYVSIAGDMEKQCDLEVELILNELKSELEKNNEDPSIVDTLRASYEDEKVLKKSYYMKRFE